MRPVRMTVALVAAVMALGAMAAASASAAPPEVGRCVKVAQVEGKYHGLYRGANCLSLATLKNGRYEWQAGAGAKNKFTASGGETTFETVSEGKVICASVSITGEYTGAKTLKISKVLLKSCEENAHRPCQTLPVAHSGEIENSGELEGELAFITGGEKPLAGWDLKRSGPLFAFTCGVVPEVASTETIEGSVIGQVTGGRESNLDKMNTKALTKFKQKFGFQQPESFEGVAKDVLTTTTVVGTSKTVLQSALNSTQSATLEEPLEIKIK